MSQEVNGVPADSELPGVVAAGALRDGDTAGDGQGLKVHPLDFATAKAPVHFDETITNFAFQGFVPLAASSGVHQNRNAL
jgi:hypothetical protein